ncbi:MAG: iron-containing alcohol dehydrogenase [Thalassobaculum sp.]|uniref:iron-containing alcohol dehydrogenase n=1 Tax=Thalassobaculum sp. TaxID=2022740 RepID=UPI0032EDE5E3
MLEAFTHDPSPSMSFGIDRLSRLSEDVVALAGPAARVLIVTDPGLMATGLPEAVAAGLRAAGHRVELFAEVRSDPTAASIDAAASRARAIEANLIVGLGGGSPLDVAKLAACVAVAEAPAEAYAVMGRPLPDKPIRKILIPTTSGTGAEMTRTSVYGTADDRKVWAWGPTLKADLSILDPVVTRGLPGPMTAATGLDALVHAIEACTHRRSTPVVEGMALQAIRLVAGNLERVVAEPGDLEARGRMALGSALAGVAIDACGTGIAHAFGHALGTLAHVHHGRAVTLAMRVALPWACVARPDLYAPVALALGVDPRGTAGDLELAMAGAARFEALLRSVGLPVSLAGDGLGEADVARLVTVTVAPENRPMVDSNAVRPTDEDLVTLARAILTAA